MDLLCFADRKRSLQTLFSDADFTPPNFIFGEVVPCRITKLLQRQLNQSRIWDIDPNFDATWLVEIGIGRAYVLPISGTFTLAFGADTTTDLPYNISAVNLAIALNILTGIIAAGGVTVTGADGFFQVTFGNTGHQLILVGDTTLLAPSSLIEVGRLVDGAGGHHEIQVIRVVQNVAAMNQITIQEAAITITTAVVQVGGGGNNHKVRFTISKEPYDGQWTAIVSATETDFVAYNSDGPTLQAAIEGLVGVGNVQVVKEDNLNWLVMFIAAKANTNMGAISTNAALKAIDFMTGNLDLRSGALGLLMANNSSIGASLEVQATPSGGDPIKLYRADVTILAGIINPSDLEFLNTRFFQSGKLACPIGTTSPVSVHFPNSFPGKPNIVCHLASKGSGFTTFVAQVDEDGLSTTDADINLSGTIATHDHVLYWIASFAP